LLKAMLTTACERDCLYCSFRAGRDCRRVTFGPDEMAGLYAQAHRAGLVDGLFLSTGILKGGANTQDKLIATAEILRHRLGYRGYLHQRSCLARRRGRSGKRCS
jgi:predicted DNA-binding helix-hairpin-helix protein